MGSRQIVQGNPEQKQYYVINNFSGGINTTDVDDIMGDNEFRLMQNVELAKGGIFQNRQGFGAMSLLNELLYDKGINITHTITQKLQFIKVVKNTYNTMAKFEQYSTLAALISGTSLYDLKLHILLAIDGIFYLLRVEKAVGAADFTCVKSTLGYLYSGTSFTWALLDPVTGAAMWITNGAPAYDILGLTSADLPDATVEALVGRLNTGTVQTPSYEYYIANAAPAIEGYDNVVAIETADYLDYVYFLGSALSPECPGHLYQYNTETLYLTRYIGGNIYKPTPYQVTSTNGAEGFNVLADAPLSYVKDQDIGLKSILGVFLTNTTTGAYLERIPVTGVFTVNVFQTGSTMFPEELTLSFKTSGDVEINYTLVGASDEGGYFSYDIADMSIGNYAYIVLDITSTAPKTIAGGLYPYNGIAVGDYVYVVDDIAFYLKKAATFGYSLADYTKYKAVRADANNYQTPSASWDAYKTSAYDGKFFIGVDNGYYTLFQYSQAQGLFILVQDTTAMFATNEEIVSSKFDIIKDIAGIYYTRTGSAGSANDFVELVDYTAESIPPLLGQNLDIGITADEKVITSIDLKDARMKVVNVVYSAPRMLFYKGNTMWFSEIGIFDYLPNRNFVIIPLSAEDEITSVDFYRNTYIIFTKEKIFKMSGDYESSSFSISLVNAHIGCIAPNSVRGINNALAFVSRDGLYKLTANNYSDGIENVTKIDKKIKGLVDLNEDISSLMYNEQYLMFLKDGYYDVLKYYYNVDLAQGEHPYVVDLYAVKPETLFRSEQLIVGYQNGLFYVYDKGYTDFMPEDETEDAAYLYYIKVLSGRFSIGYPTHDKKFKSMFIKTYYAGDSLLYVNVYVDDFLVVDPHTYKVVKNSVGVLTYVEYVDPEVDSQVTLTLSNAELGTFVLDEDALGDSPMMIHKIPIGKKGKTVQIMFEHKSNGSFGISSIGYIYKVGKVKESR